MLKERIRVVCCSCYARGEHPERKVVKTAKATTGGHEGVLRCTQCVGVVKGTLSLRVRRLRNHFFFFSGGLTVSLVTVHLADLRFLLFFISILGEVVAMGEEGPVLVVLGAELSPFEALMNFLP